MVACTSPRISRNQLEPYFSFSCASCFHHIKHQSLLELSIACATAHPLACTTQILLERVCDLFSPCASVALHSDAYDDRRPPRSFSATQHHVTLTSKQSPDGTLTTALSCIDNVMSRSPLQTLGHSSTSNSRSLSLSSTLKETQS